MNFEDTRIFKTLMEEPFHKVAPKILRLTEEGRDVNFVGDHGQGYLHVIAELAEKFRDPRSVPVVYQLCLAGIDVNKRDSMGDTCLHKVVRQKGVFRIVIALLRCGADPSLTDGDARTPEDVLTVEKPSGWEETLYWLRKYSPGLPNLLRQYPVHISKAKELLSSWCRLYAMEDGCKVCLIDRYKKQSYVEEDLLDEMEKQQATNELALATLAGSVKRIKALGSDTKADVNTSDALYQYHHTHSPVVAQPLLATAWEQDNYDVIDAFMSLEPDTIILYSNHDGRSRKPLVFHILSGQPRPQNMRVIHRILRGADLSKRNHKGQTVLYEGVDQKIHVNVFKDIISYGVDIAARDYKGRTVRDYANELDCNEYMQVIDDRVIQAVEDKDITRIEDWVSREYDHVEDVIQRGLSDDDRLKQKIEDNRLYKETAECIDGLNRLQRLCRLLMDAADEGHVDTIRKHATGHVVFCQNTCGHTLLHRVIMSRDEQSVIEMLIAYPNLMDVPDNLQRTSYHYACLFFGRNHEVSQMMRQLGARCDILDTHGHPPEEYSADNLTTHQYKNRVREVTEFEATVFLRRIGFECGLKRAIKDGDLDSVHDLLIQAGTKVQMPAHSQLVFYCVDHDQPDIAVFLLQNGCEADIWKKYHQTGSSPDSSRSKTQDPMVSLLERSREKGFDILADYVEEMMKSKNNNGENSHVTGPLQEMSNFGMIAQA